jgi:hypothetical protein
MWRRVIKSIVVCDIILMISSFVIACIIHYEVVSFHVSIISPNCCYISVPLCFKRGVCVCVWPSFTKDVCDHNTLFTTTKALLIPGGDWCSWVGMYLEKANVGLGFFLQIGRHWDMGQIASTWNHHVQCFLLTKIVVFWTKKLGMSWEINKNSCKLEYKYNLKKNNSFYFELKILQKNHIIKFYFILFLHWMDSSWTWKCICCTWWTRRVLVWYQHLNIPAWSWHWVARLTCVWVWGRCRFIDYRPRYI